MDILWFAVKITFRLLVGFLKATYWMFKKALPWARRQGESFSKQVNLTRYPFPFGNLAVEMTTLWFLLAVISGLIFSGRMQNNVVPALFLGLIVLPLFLGFGQGVRKPPMDDQPIPRFDPAQRLGSAEDEETSAPPQLPTIASLQQAVPPFVPTTVTLPEPALATASSPISGATRLTSEHVDVSDMGLPKLASLEAESIGGQGSPPLSGVGGAGEVLLATAPASARERLTSEEWQALLEAPELVIYTVMRLGERTGPLQLAQEVAAGALAITKANDSTYELIREASQWRDFGTIEGTRPEVLPDVTLTHCQQIVAILDSSVSTDEARAFTAWLLELARVVASAASERGLGGQKVSAQEEEFLGELALVLNQTSAQS